MVLVALELGQFDFTTGTAHAWSFFAQLFQLLWELCGGPDLPGFYIFFFRMLSLRESTQQLPKVSCSYLHGKLDI